MLKINRTETEISIESPYSPVLPARAKSLSGRWNSNSRMWVFPIGAEPQVKELYMDVYGEWDDISIETVNLICEVKNGHSSAVRECIEIHGKIIACASGRDSGAKTSNGIIIISGGFTSGGSVKNWHTICKENTKFKILNIPKTKAEQIIDDPDWIDVVKIEPIEDNGIKKANLISEKEKLEKRLDEINSLLSDLN